jgi:2-oxoglutarate ferredoxin oxidoreductase subunit gamma
MMCKKSDLAQRDPLKILISGTAGQGAVFSAALIARAAVLENKYVSETARSSAAVRSGRSTAHLIISNTPIDFPLVDDPDIFVALSERAFEQENLITSGIDSVFYDASVIFSSPPFPHAAIYPISASCAAKRACIPDANLVIIGAVCSTYEFVPFNRLLSIVDTFDDTIREADRKALLVGRRLSRDPGVFSK